jgi:hypothetical protein
MLVAIERGIFHSRFSPEDSAKMNTLECYSLSKYLIAVYSKYQYDTLLKLESNLNTTFLRISIPRAVKFCAVPLAAKLKGH